MYETFKVQVEEEQHHIRQSQAGHLVVAAEPQKEVEEVPNLLTLEQLQGHLLQHLAAGKLPYTVHSTGRN